MSLIKNQYFDLITRIKTGLFHLFFWILVVWHILLAVALSLMANTWLFLIIFGAIFFAAFLATMTAHVVIQKKGGDSPKRLEPVLKISQWVVLIFLISRP